MKKPIFSILVSCATDYSFAVDFSIIEGRETAEFTKIEQHNDGTAIYAARKTYKDAPGFTIDRYSINCVSRVVTVEWGRSYGNATGVPLPGGGKAQITNRSNLQKYLARACK